MSSKLRLLYVKKILFEKSDELHPVSSTQIINYLKKYGISCDKKSVYSDVAVLREFGDDILVTDSPKKGYALVSRTFELPEVRLLVDAVQSANFITAKKTQQLLSKLETLTADFEAKEIINQVYVDHCVKSKNETVYYTIDALHNAIVTNKKVSFLYIHRELNCTSGSIFKEKNFVVSPYALIWNNDHYYLACNYDKYDNTMNLRIDKIKDIKVLDEERRHFSEVTPYIDFFDTSDYAKKQFNMFTGETQKIEFLCSYSLLDAVLDNFGEWAKLTAYDKDNILVEIDAAVSDGLVSWFMQYGEKVIIRSPDCLKEMFLNKINRIVRNYV